MTITIHDELRSQLRIHIDGIPAHTLQSLLMSSNHGPWSVQDISDAMGRALADNFAFIDTDGRWHQTAFSIAQERYQEILPQSFADRVGVWIANLWHKCWGGILLLIATAFFALGLCAQEGHWTVAEVTSYCPCALCCGDSADGVTANMTRTDRVPYAFAADRSLPFGTRVYVPAGLGVLDRARANDRWLVVDDRGGALDTEARRYRILRLDLRVREHAWAVQFGRRTLPVFIDATR